MCAVWESCCRMGRMLLLGCVGMITLGTNLCQCVFCELPEKGLGIHPIVFWCEEGHCGDLRLTFCQNTSSAVNGQPSLLTIDDG